MDINKKKILLVEDDEINIRLFQDYLLFKGYEVITTPNGLDALVMNKEYMPDLILIDINLFGISGADVAYEIRKDGAFDSTPIIAMTAFPVSRMSNEIQYNCFDAIIEKPITFSEFTEVIEKFI